MNAATASAAQRAFQPTATIKPPTNSMTIAMVVAISGSGTFLLAIDAAVPSKPPILPNPE